MNTTDILAVFGRNVRDRRRAQGLSQEELADRAQIDRTYVSGIERDRRNPSLRVVARIAQALNVPVADLFE